MKRDYKYDFREPTTKLDRIIRSLFTASAYIALIASAYILTVIILSL